MFESKRSTEAQPPIASRIMQASPHGRSSKPMTRREVRFFFRTTAILLFAIGLFAAAQFSPPFGSWERLSSKPIISPQGTGFESAGTFNPAVVEKDGKIVMLYRAQ